MGHQAIGGDSTAKFDAVPLSNGCACMCCSGESACSKAERRSPSGASAILEAVFQRLSSKQLLMVTMCLVEFRHKVTSAGICGANCRTDNWSWSVVICTLILMLLYWLYCCISVIRLRDKQRSLSTVSTPARAMQHRQSLYLSSQKRPASSNDHTVRLFAERLSGVVRGLQL